MYICFHLQVNLPVSLRDAMQPFQHLSQVYVSEKELTDIHECFSFDGRYPVICIETVNMSVSHLMDATQ